MSHRVRLHSWWLRPKQALTPLGVHRAVHSDRPSALSAVGCIFPLILRRRAPWGLVAVAAAFRLHECGGVSRPGAGSRTGSNMDPSASTPEHRLFWHNLPVWSWSFLWPPTLIFGMWQILVADQFSIWE